MSRFALMNQHVKDDLRRKKLLEIESKLVEHRFPPQIVAHAVRLYFRFPLSMRLVEELLLERGIAVSLL